VVPTQFTEPTRGLAVAIGAMDRPVPNLIGGRMCLDAVLKLVLAVAALALQAYLTTDRRKG
jgi:hypothetical protein